MRITFTVYKKSAFATVVNIIGVLMMAIGIYGLIYSIAEKNFSLVNLAVIAAGIALILFSSRVNKHVVDKKIKESYEDKKLINLISTSAVAAYSLFLNNPCPEMLAYINTHNSFAASRIEEMIRRQITE